MDLPPSSGSGFGSMNLPQFSCSDFEVWIFFRIQVHVPKYGSSSAIRFRFRGMDHPPPSGSVFEI
jgi:hypothetical protein